MNDHESGIDGGEAFQPADTPEPTTKLDDRPVPVSIPKLEAAKVAEQLRKATGHLDNLAGDGFGAELQMTEWEASMAAPALVAYVNSRPKVAAAVAAGGNEYLKGVVGLGAYGLRVTRERARTIEARMAAEAAMEAAAHEHAANERVETGARTVPGTWHPGNEPTRTIGDTPEG